MFWSLVNKEKRLAFWSLIKWTWKVLVLTENMEMCIAGLYIICSISIGDKLFHDLGCDVIH